MKIILLLLLFAGPVSSFADDAIPDNGPVYDKKTKTFSDVFKTFRDSLMSAPVLSASGQFLDVSVGAGGCPSSSFSVSLVDVDINLAPFFCSDGVHEALRVFGIAVLFTAVYFAVRIAFL